MNVVRKPRDRFWQRVALSALAIALLPDTAARAQSDGRALNTIFAGQHLPESGLGVCDRARQMPEGQRIQYLKDWVLPSETHAEFRMTSDFASSYEEDGEDCRGESRLVSPAMDLVRLAVRMGQADQLRESIRHAPAPSKLQQSRQIALLAMLAMEEKDAAQATQQLDQFYQLVLADTAMIERERQSLLLTAVQAAPLAEPSSMALEALTLVTQHFNAVYDRDAFHRHLWAAKAVLMEQVNPSAALSREGSDRSTQWYPVSRSTAFEQGNAFPAARWRVTDGSARNLSSYGDDFLFFAAPLTGRFEIETHATGFGYRESELMVAGKWFGLVYDHKHYAIGNLRGELERVELRPAMSSTNSHGFIHHRVKTGQGVSTTFFNGRKVVDQPLVETPYPWVAVRSSVRVNGGVDDLRITGAPEIPDSISLVESPQLLGWYDYYQKPGGNPNRLAGWQGHRYTDASGQLITKITDASRRELTPGCAAEHLLVYLRPMLEDGTIQYRFWYSPGESSAHPALGDTCFLLTPGGVKLHRISDGRYERARRRPDNHVNPFAESSSASQPLSLKSNAWNQLRLQLSGDQLTLELNGEEIHKQQTSCAPADRKFGLFHYADRTDLQVKDLIWKGDWPKHFPALKDQHLATYANQSLEETSPDLPASFQQALNHQSMLSGKFTVVEGNAVTGVKPDQAEGLVVRRDGVQGYTATAIAPALQVGGDFDVTVTFDQFVCESVKGNIGSVRMWLTADSDASDMALIQRIVDRRNDQGIQCLIKQVLEGNERRHYFASQPMEANAGRLRLSRRGEKIYYLIAENDSSQFRLLGHEDFAASDLQNYGIRFGVQIQGPGGYSQARFTHIDVRAERLSGVATQENETLVAQLNAQRDKLPLALKNDFAKKAPDPIVWYRWTDRRPWDSRAAGLPIDSPGADNWTSAGMSLRQQFVGDFDVSFAFEPISIATPKQGDHSQVYLQIELADSEKTQLSTMLTKMPTGETVCQGQIRTPNGKGYRYDNVGTLPFSQPEYLRMARRGNDVYFLAGTVTDSQEYLLGTVKTSQSLIGIDGLRLMVHTGGDGRRSQVLLKSIEVRSESTSQRIVRPEVMPQKSLPGRLFDSIRSVFQ